MARLERLNSFGPQTVGTKRADSVLAAREMIIAESVAHHQQLTELRNQIGSWKDEIGEESPQTRVLAAEAAVDEHDQGLLDRLRRDIASFANEEVDEQDEPENDQQDEGLNELRGNLSGLFGKTVSDSGSDGNKTQSLADTSATGKPGSKDEAGQEGEPSSVKSETGKKLPAGKSGSGKRLGTPVEDDLQSDTATPDDRHHGADKNAYDRRMDMVVSRHRDTGFEKSRGSSAAAFDQNVILDRLAGLQSEIEALGERQRPSQDAQTGELRDLIAELSQEVVALKASRREASAPDHDALYSLVADLKEDVRDLKEQQGQAKTFDDVELSNLVAGLKGEIRVLNEQNNRPLAPDVEEILGLFAELKTDISNLKEDAERPIVPEVSEILGLFAELKSDIATLREEQQSSVPAGDNTLVDLVTELKSDLKEFREEQKKNVAQSDNTLLEMFAELQGEFAELRKTQAARENGLSGKEAREIRALVDQMKRDLEDVRDGQMKTVELVQITANDEIQTLLADVKNGLGALQNEQAAIDDSDAFPASSCERINHLLVALKDEIDTARSGENAGEDGVDIEKLSAVNSVLTLLIGDNGLAGGEKTPEKAATVASRSRKKPTTRKRARKTARA